MAAVNEEQRALFIYWLFAASSQAGSSVSRALKALSHLLLCINSWLVTLIGQRNMSLNDVLDQIKRLENWE